MKNENRKITKTAKKRTFYCIQKNLHYNEKRKKNNKIKKDGRKLKEFLKEKI